MQLGGEHHLLRLHAGCGHGEPPQRGVFQVPWVDEEEPLLESEPQLG